MTWMIIVDRMRSRPDEPLWCSPVAYKDGSVRPISDRVAKDVWRALGTRGAGNYEVSTNTIP